MTSNDLNSLAVFEPGGKTCRTWHDPAPFPSAGYQGNRRDPYLSYLRALHTQTMRSQANPWAVAAWLALAVVRLHTDDLVV